MFALSSSSSPTSPCRPSSADSTWLKPLCSSSCSPRPRSPFARPLRGEQPLPGPGLEDGAVLSVVGGLVQSTVRLVCRTMASPSTNPAPAPSSTSAESASTARHGASPLPRSSSTETFDPVFDLDLEKRLDQRESSPTATADENAVIVSASSPTGPVTLPHDDLESEFNPLSSL